MVSAELRAAILDASPAAREPHAGGRTVARRTQPMMSPNSGFWYSHALAHARYHEVDELLAVGRGGRGFAPETAAGDRADV